MTAIHALVVALCIPPLRKQRMGRGWPVFAARRTNNMHIHTLVVGACSDAGVPVLVDGAHSVGSLYDLKVPELGCSYFVSTLHKWLCTPKVQAL